MDAAQREAALRLLAKIEAQDEARMMERATGWAVLSRDDEFGTYYLVGTFDEAPAAVEYERKMAAQLETLHDPATKGWSTFVLPVMPPT